MNKTTVNTPFRNNKINIRQEKIYYIKKTNEIKKNKLTLKRRTKIS